MYDGRYENINSQTNSSTKYISNIYGGVMQNEIHVRSQGLEIPTLIEEKRRIKITHHCHYDKN